ncbi:MAG: excinuclease ABC subunit UvrC [Candidatus Omnitrophota bacterium]
MDIQKKIKKIPASPGVYIFRGKVKEILYIGKASNLKRRVSSYFQKSDKPSRTRLMVSQIRDLDYITTSSSAEALIYEANLIKEKRPKYNVEHKDDKSYPLLKLTVNERFPRLLMVRGKTDDSALYYGPYTNVKLLRKALSIMQGIFILRTCNKIPKRACLKAEIEQCVAPCDGSISETNYSKVVDQVKLFLEGRKADLIKQLSAQMRQASKDERFEEAIFIRDKIDALSSMWSGRKPPPPLNREIAHLKHVLHLPILPARIEAFDISNIQGVEAVGSMVSFFSGKPQKDEYRRFRIKGSKGIDDYGMMQEVIKRRYLRILKDRDRLPDLIVIDGGKGHLNAARKAMNSIGLLNVPIISIAKENEYIYKEGSGSPLKLSGRMPALKLIMRIRDEAHRFAIAYHKLLRGKDVLVSVLDDIDRIGMRRKKALMVRFGSVENVRKADLEQLKSAQGMTKDAAEEVLRYFSAKTRRKQ